MPATDAEFIAWAASKIGTPYQWGGTGPPQWTGYDCSGLVYADALTFGIMLPRTSQDMWAAAENNQCGLRVVENTDADPVRPADLPFFSVASDGSYQPAHMGIYVGPNLMIEAPHTGEDVKYSAIPNVPGELLMGFARITALVPGPTPIPGPTPTPEPSPPVQEAADMATTDPISGGEWVTNPTGDVDSFDGAPYLGGLNNHPDWKAGGGTDPCVGITAWKGDGTNDNGNGYVLFTWSATAKSASAYRFPRGGGPNGGPKYAEGTS